MREVIKIFNRQSFNDSDFIDGNIPVAGRKFEAYNEIALENIADGEQIVDIQYNRPLVKVNGALKQLKSDSDGLIYYDTPSLIAGGPTASSSSSSGGTTTTDTGIYVSKIDLSYTLVPSIFAIATIPAGYVLEEIVIHVDTTFTTDNRIMIQDSSVTLVASTRFDNRVIPIWKPYTVDMPIVATLTGTSTAGAGWILVKAIKVT